MRSSKIPETSSKDGARPVPTSGPKHRRHHRRRLFYQTFTVVVALVLGVVFVARRLLVDLPDPAQLYQRATAPSTKIYDRRGTLLYEIIDPHQGLHTPLVLADIPPACRNATVATEDATFYSNPGVDGAAIVRALYINLRGGEILSGGSTITQQLARNLLLSPDERTEVSLSRKLREAILAWRIARRYTKDEILTLYLNETYYGNLAYGLEAASRTYFGKRATELDLAECALLAGLPQSPANYNPLQNLPAAKTRQGLVLNLMVKNGFLSQGESELVHREELSFAAVPIPIEAPHFVMYVYGQLEKQFGLETIYTRGLQVQTTLDLPTHEAARRSARFRLEQLDRRTEGRLSRNVRNAAVIVLDPQTGEVLAMVGSPDYFDRRIDGAVNATVALRQPGSSIKPITYAAAFDPAWAEKYSYQTLNPASMMVDSRTAFTTREGEPYVPINYDRRWRGPVLLRQALASSLNLVAVKVLDHVGVEAMTALARSMGITTLDDVDRFGLALTLGGGEVRLLDLTAAYAVFANGGRRVEPVTILRVADAAGRVLWQRRPGPGEQVLDPRSSYLITDILSDNYARSLAFGENSSLRLSGGRPAAAKTGTTSDFRDNWTIGYTPDFVTGVWMGNTDNEAMRQVSGINGAAPIWQDVMEALHQALPVRLFARPPGLVEVNVCTGSGLLSPPQPAVELSSGRDSGQAMAALPCLHEIRELFIEGTQPVETDHWHVRLALDRRNGLRARNTCPPEFVVYRQFVLYPAEARVWAREQGIPQPPGSYSPLCSAGGEVGEKDLETSASASMDGASAGDFRMETNRDTLVPNTPGLVFTTPDQGATFRLASKIPLDRQKIRVAVRPTDGAVVGEVQVWVDGELLADQLETLWQMTPGRHTFEVVGIDSRGRPIRGEPVTIKVER
jgi:1A family penicillin-binding protein